jgi:uncharacterized membrane protein YdjX (TVP38/TMEM64 family)
VPGSGPSSPPRPGGGAPLLGIALTLAGIGVLALLVLAIDPLRDGLGDALRGDTASLRDDLRGLGVGGALIVLALALAHSVVWYPAEILDAAVGYVYDFWVALPLLMAAWVLNGLVCWVVGRYAARPFLIRWLGEGRFSSYERAVGRGGVTLLLGMRLVPVIPFSLFSYAAGSARVPLGRFLWTTAVGYLPLTAIFAYLGSRLEELSFDDPLLWAGAAVILGLLLLTRGVVRKLGIGQRDPD